MLAAPKEPPPDGPPAAPRAAGRLDKPDLYVVARFLDKLGQPGKEYSKNQLQMAVRLNYDLYRRYLNFLLEKGFVTVREGSKTSDQVRITAAGLKARAALLDWIRDVLGDGVL